MVNMLIRGIIIYVTVIFAVRLMGKRQIGELQPAELVVTILLSQVASMPFESLEVPLLSILSIVFLLIGLEILCSVISMKTKTFRNLIQGNPILIIKNGKLVQSELKNIRYSVEDLLEALRLKDIFDISQVQFAYIETNGSISVLLKNKYRPVTIDDTDIKAQPCELPCLVISDGRIVKSQLDICAMTDKRLSDIMKKEQLKLSDIMLMTAEKGGKYYIVRKDKSK
ncbi:MAG: DUF421 domain-containing protein [Clostridia bacterium]|nr:DUF421 domain-containing protein [Clostridia bacterium]